MCGKQVQVTSLRQNQVVVSRTHKVHDVGKLSPRYFGQAMAFKGVLAFICVLLPTVSGCVKFKGGLSDTGVMTAYLWDNAPFVLGQQTCTITNLPIEIHGGGVYFMDCSSASSIDYVAAISLDAPSNSSCWNVHIQDNAPMQLTFDACPVDGVFYEACEYSCTDCVGV
jgi:hypothetical protein